MARFVLISKGNGDPQVPPAYGHFVCFAGLEKLIRSRLAKVIYAVADIIPKAIKF